MAGNGEANTDFGAHEHDYSRFLWIMKWGTIASFIVAAVVILLIAS